MATNNRIFYACQAVAICPRGTTTVGANHVVRGAQSVGMTSTFTLDQVFELGQLEIYENVEEVADVEVNIEKVIDGQRLLFDLASDGACKTSLTSAAKARSDVYVAIFDDGQDNATGVPKQVCMNSGMFISSISYNYSVDGSATESISLVGNDRFWNAVSNVVADPSVSFPDNLANSLFDGADEAPSGVVRRANLNLTGSSSVIPAEVISNAGDDAVGNGGAYHIQSVSVSADFGNESIQELGRFGPFTRYATFPIEVTCEFEVSATKGDLVNVSGNAQNLQNRQIVLQDDAGTIINLGSKNKLTSVGYTGGDTGGGNATMTFSYSNFNSLSVDGGSYSS